MQWLSHGGNDDIMCLGPGIKGFGMQVGEDILTSGLMPWKKVRVMPRNLQTSDPTQIHRTYS